MNGRTLATAAALVAASMLPARAAQPPNDKPIRLQAAVVLSRMNGLLRELTSESRWIQDQGAKPGNAQETLPAVMEVSQQYGCLQSALFIAALTSDPWLKLDKARADERQARGRFETYRALVKRALWAGSLAARGIAAIAQAQEQAEELQAQIRSRFSGPEQIAIAIEPYQDKYASLRVYAPKTLDPRALAEAVAAAHVTLALEVVDSAP